MNDKKRLLAVFAHPDDESFGPGGTLARYAQSGVEVHLICATRGEVGNIPEALVGKENSVAELREAELRCAAYQLGLEKVHFLDYRDSGMSGSEENNHPTCLAQAPIDGQLGQAHPVFASDGFQFLHSVQALPDRSPS